MNFATALIAAGVSLKSPIGYYTFALTTSLLFVRHFSEEALIKKKTRRKRKKGNRPVPEKVTAPNHVWTVDFVHDRLSRGGSIRLLTVLDEFTRESLCIRIERRLKSEDVRLTLETLFKDYGANVNQKMLSCDGQKMHNFASSIL